MRIEIEDGYVRGYVDYRGYGDIQAIGLSTNNGVLKVETSVCLPVKHEYAKRVLECMNAAFAKAEEMIS